MLMIMHSWTGRTSNYSRADRLIGNPALTRFNTRLASRNRPLTTTPVSLPSTSTLKWLRHQFALELWIYLHRGQEDRSIYTVIRSLRPNTRLLELQWPMDAPSLLKFSPKIPMAAWFICLLRSMIQCLWRLIFTWWEQLMNAWVSNS